ncbi:MAG: peptide chain release factor N(5)-glutamine methyltransferase [Alloprevotella sp.]|nr:peptide chain release factor N(5)-glutamine methyltransferase [Alloprevotella sp.]
MNPSHDILRTLRTAGYEASEARAVAFLLLEEGFGVGRVAVYADKVRDFSEEESLQLENMLQRLAAGTPVQYVLGRTTFCGLSFGVGPGVLIPRPETEELVAIAAEMVAGKGKRGDGEAHNNYIKGATLIDLGTGSGCIAVTLKKRYPALRVEGWDISPAALAIARANAERLGADVRLREADLLAATLPACPEGSFLVSNPPYVRRSEAAAMEAIVLDHEPHTALIVPDDDPLCFYRAIERLARQCRTAGVALEVNAALADETAALFGAFADVTVLPDAFGRPRFVRTGGFTG